MFALLLRFISVLAFLILGNSLNSQAATSAYIEDLNLMADNLPSEVVIRGLELNGKGIVDLRVKEEQVFSLDAKVIINNGESAIPSSNVRFLRGMIEGMPGSIVAITLTKDGIQGGLITDGDAIWELNRKSVDAPLEALPVERNHNFKQKPFVCGQEKLPEIPSQNRNNDQFTSQSLIMAGEEPTSLPLGQLYQVTVAIDSDYEFYQKFGSVAAATNYIGSLFNFIGGIYEAEVQTRLLVGNIYLWTTSDDPWVETSGTACRLYEFGRFWRDHRSHVTRTIAHFLSGASLGGGVAWLNTLCEPPTTHAQDTGCATVGTELVAGGFGVSANIADTVDTSASPAWDAIVVAHELGHNFSSPHSHCYAGIGGNSNPVDACYVDEIESACWSGGTSLPGVNSLAGGVSNSRNGTLMSFCHSQTGGMGNIAGTFGFNHPYGINADRISNRMFSGVAKKATSYPACIPIVGATLASPLSRDIAPAVSLPPAPSWLMATAVSSSQISLSWGSSSGAIVYLIERKAQSENSYREIASVGGGTYYNDIGLPSGTTYSYRVRAKNYAGYSAYSSVATATTKGTYIARPWDLTARAVSSSSITLRWKDNSYNETGFAIERKIGSMGIYEQIAKVDANVSDFAITGLRAGNTYYFRVRAYNDTGISDYSNEASATTPNVTAPVAPSALKATAASATQIKLNWVDNSSDETGFYIERKTGATGTYAPINNVAPEVTSYTDNGLAGGTTYYYRVHAYNNGGQSSYSNEAYATTSVVPTAPYDLTATAVSSSQINLNWRDYSNDETGFYIERKTGAMGTYVQIATVSAGVQSYASTGLTAGTTYYYRVRAYNGNVNSSYSNEAYATPLSGTCSSSKIAIRVGTTSSGTLADTDCKSTRRTGSYYDNFTFTATAGLTYTIEMTSNFNNYLILLDSSGIQRAYNDNYNGTNARIVYTPTTSGTLTIHATSYSSGMTGSYTVSLR